MSFLKVTLYIYRMWPCLNGSNTCSCTCVFFLLSWSQFNVVGTGLPPRIAISRKEGVFFHIHGTEMEKTSQGDSRRYDLRLWNTVPKHVWQCCVKRTYCSVMRTFPVKNNFSDSATAFNSLMKTPSAVLFATLVAMMMSLYHVARCDAAWKRYCESALTIMVIDDEDCLFI